MEKTKYRKYQEEKESLLWEKYRDLSEEVLISLLDDNDAMKRRVAAQQLQLKAGDRIIQLAKMYCFDANYRRRAEGAFILGQIQLPPTEEVKAIDLLYGLTLHDKSAMVRSNAIFSMGHRCKRNNKYAPQLIALSQLIIQDQSPNVREGLAFALSCINDEQSIPLLLKLVKDTHGNVRDWAAFAINLNEYNSPEIRDCFAVMLLDYHLGARGEAINGLARRQDKRVTNILAEELKKDTVYDDFVEAAGELGDITLLPILRELISRFGHFDVLDSSIDKLKKILPN